MTNVSSGFQGCQPSDADQTSCRLFLVLPTHIKMQKKEGIIYLSDVSMVTDGQVGIRSPNIPGLEITQFGKQIEFCNNIMSSVCEASESLRAS
jgi:hypothetical protein